MKSKTFFFFSFIVLSITINAQIQDFNYFGQDSSKVKYYQEITQAINLKMYATVIDKLTQVENECGLTEAGFIEMVSVNFTIENYDKVISYCTKWEQSGISPQNIDLFYDIIAGAYYFKKDYLNCIKISEKAIINPNCNNKSEFYIYIARSYSQQNNGYMANSFSHKFIKARLQELNISEDYIRKYHPEDVNLGWAYAFIAKYMVNTSTTQNNSHIEYIKLSAACGFPQAIKLCENFSIPY